MNLTATLHAPAKINLFLDILGIRSDGYHELDTLFMPLDHPRDTLEFSPAPVGSGLMLECSIPNLDPLDNLIYKAWKKFGDKTGFAPDIEVVLEKRIPMGAGLGGGSTDAAAMLRYLNERAGDLALWPDQMISLAAEIGADVPFFLLDGPARATGIGEELTPVDLDLSGFTLVLVCPDVHVSSAWAYREWDRVHSKQEMKSDMAQPLTSSATGTKNPIPDLAVAVGNAFESVVFPAYPMLREIKENLLISGASAAAMSGSGASIFAVFRDPDSAASSVRRFETENILTFSQIL